MAAIVEMRSSNHSPAGEEEQQLEQQLEQQAQQGRHNMSAGEEEEDMVEEADEQEIDDGDEEGDEEEDFDNDEEEVLVLVDLPEYSGVALFERAESIEIKVSTGGWRRGRG